MAEMDPVEELEAEGAKSGAKHNRSIIMTETILTAETDLETRFSDAVKVDESERYEGILLHRKLC